MDPLKKEVNIKQGTTNSFNPVIHVIFQKEINEEELISEIADMYIENRIYYYTGKLSSEKQEEEIHTKFSDVQWDKLESINV